MKKFIFSIFILFAPFLLSAQSTKITNFTIKESLTNPAKLSIIATDADNNPEEHLNGTFIFSINGFKQEMRFHNGVATTKDPVESSTFTFLKHKNVDGSNSKLYYVFKGDNGLNPIKISGMALLLIPALILLIAYVFKKLIVTAIVLVLGMSFFNMSHGLKLDSIIETILNSIKGLFF